MKQQNRFCGVVLKKRDIFNAPAAGFQKITDNFYVKSVQRSLFDGYIPAVTEFNHDTIAFYEGAWAVCEHKNDHILLSRDRVGARSIYYQDHDDFFAFANDLKGLLSLPLVKFKASTAGAFDFFFQNKTPGLIQNVHEIKPAHILKYNLKSHFIDLSPYYQFQAQEVPGDESEIVEKVREGISEKINRTLDNCTGIASFLSGGIDSSVIATVANANRKIPYITGLSSQDENNEIPFADELVKHLGIQEWHQVLTENIDHEIENLHAAMELPTTSLGSFLQYELMRFCKHKGITDVLDGTGADALFAGHNYDHAFYWNELLRKGKLGKVIVDAGTAQLGEFWPKYYVKNMLKYYYFPRFKVASQLKIELRNNPLLHGLNPDLIATEKQNLETAPGHNLKKLNNRLQHDFLSGGVTELLRFPDRIGKSFGVANHSIFSMYPTIFEYALNIPSHLKISHGYSKYILRKSFESQLPEKILSRRDKMGLVAPNNYWMKQHKDLFLSYFDDSLSEFYKVDTMRQLISDAIDESSEVENYKVFKFISFAIWHKVMSK